MNIALDEMFAFPFKDKKGWLKILIAVGLGIIPVVCFFSVGYLCKIFKAAILKQPRELPEWGDWGPLFLTGLFVTCLGLIYAIPVAVLIILASALAYILPVLSVWFWILALSGVMFVTFVMPFAVGRYLVTEKLKEALELKKIVDKIRSVLKDYAIAFLIGLGLLLFFGFILNLIPYVGPIIFMFVSYYIGIVTVRMMGEIYPAEKAK